MDQTDYESDRTLDWSGPLEVHLYNKYSIIASYSSLPYLIHLLYSVFTFSRISVLYFHL
ncbi:hypothetical protein HanHA300_Chr02g0065831 [Helianthus annuus]|nr:hypothetical protein HanHA300_Chr02g0065831 [Helianthus annuus]KAJ0619705.1 hypothetical protein HanHA89_Chr02g0074221 [Helianthus annuus]KAJ0778165.1 hypothetical protein HanLR1_Chr02g0068651 [Helianthus annuus]KAJ0787166.1 hypothetical protein HanOQP8_Chr02g0079401 [Helianthus annuus]